MASDRSALEERESVLRLEGWDLASWELGEVLGLFVVLEVFVIGRDVYRETTERSSSANLNEKKRLAGVRISLTR